MPGIFDQITGQSEEIAEDVEGTEPHLDTSKLASKECSKGSPIESDFEGRTERRIRDASQELLRFGLLEESQKPNLYRVAIANMREINSILEPLDLSAFADEIRGLVYLRVRKDDVQEDQDEWSHPLVRKQRLTLEQSLLIAILRQYFIAYEQDAGSGASQAIVAVDELIPQLQVYLGDSGSEAKERTRALNLLDQLKGHGLVSAPDSHDRITIRPMIAHLANPENLQGLLNGLKQRLSESESSNDQEEQP
ncbi:hypothetical protein OLMES_5606 [Oleiphilus messinensis]|uniref:DUF4194 domain-containing protein n=1 Tax=Oleiphilus messinensis TaxID=141451 RepID=A0A1Y0IJ93_9GAMM|nr:DUF4194 domain-containing protein [Oleiphilus messinensis]ARU59585.1 hypothetical protein OLMES_5606 [Oleiphilus messinensis]